MLQASRGDDAILSPVAPRKTEVGNKADFRVSMVENVQWSKIGDFRLPKQLAGCAPRSCFAVWREAKEVLSLERGGTLARCEKRPVRMLRNIGVRTL